MVFLRTLRKCKPLKYSPYKEEKKGTFKTTHRQVSSSSWIVSSSRAPKSAGLIFSTRYGFVFYYVWTPRNNNIYIFFKKAQYVKKCREMSGHAGRQSPWAATGWKRVVFPHSSPPPPPPPPFLLCVSLRGHPARFSGDTPRLQTAPRVLRRRWTRCVKFSWGEAPVIQPKPVWRSSSSMHACYATIAAAYLMSPKRWGGRKRKKKKKKQKRHITLKYLQKNKKACVWDDY